MGPDELVIRDNDARDNGNGYKFRKATNLTIFGNKSYYTLHPHNPGQGGEDSEGVGLNDCDNVDVYDNEFTECSHGVNSYCPPSGVVTDIYIHHNYFFDYCDKGIGIYGAKDETGEGKHDGELHIFHNVFWLDTSREEHTTKAINVFSETKVTSGQRPSYQIWNNTIRARQGIRLGVDTDPDDPQHKRIDHVVKNNIFYDCRYHILDVDETIVPGSTADRDYNCYNTFGSNNHIFHDGVKYDGTMNRTWSDYKTAAGETNSLQEDPKLLNPSTNFRLDTAGPCDDVGVDPPNNIPYNPATDLDFYDQAIVTPSMGAAEPPPPP